MWKRILMMLLLLLGTWSAFAQSVPESEPVFHFKYFLQLMNYGAKGKMLDDYKTYAKNHELQLIYHNEESREVYMVWSKNVAYQKGHMTETYTQTGERPFCLNLDLTVNGKNKFTPITITLVFPDEEAQQQFCEEGMRLGCVVNEQIEATDIDSTWSEVKGIKYILNPSFTSWRYIYFYKKDGMNMCTFLF